MTAQSLSRAVGLVGLSAPGRAERIIAVGRAVLAAGSIVAIWFDPSEPARFAPVAYATLAAYLAYALGLLVWVALGFILPTRFGLATHALDLTFIMALQVFTDAVSSPFFAYFVFALVAAALRWQRRGVLWTGPIVLGAFLTLGLLAVPLLGDPSFESNRFVIRATYLAVVGGLVAYLGGHEEQLRADLSRLAAWAPDPGRVATTGVPALLGKAAEVLDARRVAMVWEEQEEPWVYLAIWSDAAFTQTREPPGAFTPVVPEPLARSAFVCLDAGQPEATVVYGAGGQLQRWSGTAVHPDLQRRTGMRALLSTPLAGDVFSGRLFFLDTPRTTPDDLALASAVAQHVAAGIGRAILVEQLRDSAAMQERASLAHDLHDGVLQSLTGVELKLEALHGVIDQPQALRDRLDEIRRIVTDEHAEMRAFIRAVPTLTGGPAGSAELGERLEALAARVDRQWNVTVRVSTEGVSLLPGVLARNAYLIGCEGVLNAARHAKASNVTVEAVRAGGMLRLVVTDDGRGFGFDGRFDHGELARRNLGPRSLMARAEALGGHVTIQSGPRGARVEVSLPISQG